MRIGVFLPVLMATGALVAWIHEDSRAATRIVVLESLAGSPAEAVLPAFETALSGHLAVGGRTASFDRLHVERTGRAPLHLLEKLRSADLVVSFGAPAAETARVALAGSAIPHLFAFVPRGLALSLAAGTVETAEAAGTGIVTGPMPRGAAIAIAGRLLASRAGPPLRIGILHLAAPDSAETTASLVAATGPQAALVPLPVALDPDAVPGALLAAVVRVAVAAAAGPVPVEAFWVALDASAPLDLLVQAIEAETGRPVIYAPSEAAVAAGALMSLAPEPRDIGREAAALAARLLDGTPAGTIPVRAPYRVELALNLDTAAALGIVPPHELVELARGRLFR